MKVERFEELIAWQKARELTKLIYLLTKVGALSRDFGLREQMRRAAVSILSNIAEGFERGSSAEFHRFIVIAKNRAPNSEASSTSPLTRAISPRRNLTKYTPWP